MIRSRESCVGSCFNFSFALLPPPTESHLFCKRLTESLHFVFVFVFVFVFAATNREPSLLQELDNAFDKSSSSSYIFYWLEHLLSSAGWLARNLISLQVLWTGSASMAMLFLQAWLFRFDAWRTTCPPATNFLFLICQVQIEIIMWMWANPAGTKLFKESAFTGSGQTGLPACTLELEFLAGWQRPPSPSASSSPSGSASSSPPPRPSKGSGPSLSRLRSRLQPLPRQKKLRLLQRLARRQELIPRLSSQLWGWICLLPMETSVPLPRPRHTRATWEFLHLLPHLIGALPLPPRRRRLVSLHPSWSNSIWPLHPSEEKVVLEPVHGEEEKKKESAA